jgi:hypothetical protein
VTKLHYLLASNLDKKVFTVDAGREAVCRFEKLMATAGYPKAEIVSLKSSWSQIPTDNNGIFEKRISPDLENVVEHLTTGKFFPDRFRHEDRTVEAIVTELETRAKKMKTVELEDSEEGPRLKTGTS